VVRHYWAERNLNPLGTGEKQVEVKFIQGAVMLAILAALILYIAIRPLREWLLGPPDIDDRQGFPWSRKNHW
jgi:hypothetical protein